MNFCMVVSNFFTLIGFKKFGVLDVTRLWGIKDNEQNNLKKNKK